MTRVIVASLLFLIGSIESQAQSNWDYLEDMPERLIGLLDLPHTIQDETGAVAKRITIHAFSRPSEGAVIVGTIYRRDAEMDDLVIEMPSGANDRVPSLESAYEHGAAIVYERRGVWYRIRLASGSAWVNRTDPQEFLPYPDTLRDRLAHTFQTWDGTLRETPGSSGKLVPLSDGWRALLDRQLNVEYLGFRRLGDETWIHIRLITMGRCGSTVEGVTDVSGWVPAYQANRAPAIWFSARGC